jgi:hypothetical protein
MILSAKCAMQEVGGVRISAEISRCRPGQPMLVRLMGIPMKVIGVPI